jgi:ankyrin repeat protein
MEPIRKDTPLMIACRAGNTEMVRLCLHYGAKNDPHPDFGHTALHAAVLCSQLGAVSVLLEAAAASDADAAIANLADPSGQTPLHMAAERGLMSVMELLLSHGADIKRHDGAGRTAIHICSSLGHRKCLAVLLDHSGDSLIEETDNFGQTALHTAADNGQLSCTRLLLETAAEVGCRNSAGKTPYMLANSKGHYQVAQVLHEYSQNFTSNSSAPVSHTPFSSHQRSYNTSTLPGPADKYLGNLASPTSAHSPKLFRDHSDSKLQRCAIDEILPRPHTSAPSPKPSPSASTFTRKIPLFSGNAVSISTSR